MMLSYLMRTPNYGEIKAKADPILKRYAISRPPVPIKEIAERDGLNVVFVNFTSLSREVALVLLNLARHGYLLTQKTL